MNNIEFLRRKVKLSQEYVAQEIGVTQGAVSQWESGESMPRADKLPKLAELFDCEVGDFFKNEPKAG